MVGEHPDRLELGVVEEVGLVDFTDRCSPYCAFDLR